MLIPYFLSIFTSSVYIINRHLSAVQFANLFPNLLLTYWLHDGFLYYIVPLTFMNLPFCYEYVFLSLVSSYSILVHCYLQLWVICCHSCCCSVTKSNRLLCNLMDCSLPGSSVHWSSQARILDWAAISFLRGSSWPRDRTCISHDSCIGRWILYLSHQRSLGHTF